MLQRVADRYQLQRDKKRAGRQGINPLVWPAIVAALALARDAYTFVTSHQLRWTAIVFAPLLVAFLILYLCKSRLAWWLIPISAAIFLVELPFIYASSEPRARAGVLVSALLALGLLAYGLVIRSRYYAFLEEERCRAIDRNI